jgi:hypothetical protein
MKWNSLVAAIDDETITQQLELKLGLSLSTAFNCHMLVIEL